VTATSARPRVVILGGGFAGLAAARRLGERHQVTLVDRGADFEFLPSLHELVSRCKKPRSLRLDRERLVSRQGHVFRQAEVAAIDRERREVHTADGGVLPYEALIVALGSARSTHAAPGAAEHAVALRSVAEGVAIGDRLKQLVDDGGRRAVTIVGGGFTGVEVLGEVLRRYRKRRGLTVRLVHPHARLLAEQPAAVHHALRRVIDDCDVELLLDESVAAVEPGAVRLVSGRWMRSELTIWTAGGSPSPLLAAAGLAPAGEWAPVRRTLQSRACPEIFVVGDSAELRHPLAKQSYHASAMGRRAASNAARLLAGRELRKLAPPPQRLLITFGHLSGFYVDDDVVLEGAALCLAREALFQVGMAELDRGRGEAGRRRLRRRLRDAMRLRSWPGALRSVVPFPFGRAPRDRYDLPALPRVLEWRRDDGGAAAAAAGALGTSARTVRELGERGPRALRLLRPRQLDGVPPELANGG
jgi:NADH:quinone reductase (non-electrogenic)